MKELKHRQLQARLQRVESSLLRLLNRLPGLAYRCAVDERHRSTMIFVSQGCEKLLGVSRSGIMDHPVNIMEMMTLEEDLAALRRAIREATRARTGYEVYYRIRLASGEVKWIWDQGEGVYDAEGNCRFLEGIMMDVTTQKNTEHFLKKKNRQLSAPSRDSQGLGRIIGKSAAMRGVYDLIGKAARSDTNVILYGETGVGKDIVAKTVHDLSGVRGRFIPVNCGAIPEQLMESEFFGHVKGAFSGATAQREGYLAAANNGTLFLDEVGELPLHLQVKLLRVLESRTYMPVGSTESKRSRFRLICATNRDLKTMVIRKAMRADFFYRIHVLTIVVPPLRERKEDIPLLAAAYADAKQWDGRLPVEVTRALMRHDWPGNVRELHNTLERYRVFGRLEMERLSGPEARDKHDAPGMTEREVQPFPVIAVARSQGPILAEAWEKAEKKQILDMLGRHGWRKGETAAALGITPRTLQRKLKKYGIGRSCGDGD